MSCSSLAKEIQLNTDLLPKDNPYIGYFPWSWGLLLEPKVRTVATQTESNNFFNLGKKVANEYGEGWEILLSSEPSNVRT